MGTSKKTNALKTTVGIIFRPHSQDRHVLGLKVACESVVHAFFQHSDFQAMEIYCFESEIETTREFLNRRPWSREKSYTIISTHQIPKRLRSGNLSVLLGLDPWFGKHLISLRNQYCPNQIPVFFLIHTLSSPEIVHLLSEVQKVAICRDAILCSSRAGETVVRRMMRDNSVRIGAPEFRGDIRVIPFGIHDLTSAPHLRKELDIPENALVYGYVGRLDMVSKMELSTTVLAFYELNLLRSEHPIFLLLAGNFENKAYLEKLNRLIFHLKLQHRVRVFANFADKQKAQVYETIDVFVSLSDHIQETFGLSLLEAQSLGKPVIASDWNGYRDLVSHERTGFLVPTYWLKTWNRNKNDPTFPHLSFGHIQDLQIFQLQTTVVDIPSVVYAMKRLMNPELRNTMGMAAMTHVQQNFSWKSVMATLFSFYQTSKTLPLPYDLTMSELSGFNIFEFFNHYPTQILASETTYVITDYGSSILDGTETIEDYQGLWSHIFECEQLTLPILKFLRIQANETAVLAAFPDHEPETICINLAYAFKFNLIQQGDPL